MTYGNLNARLYYISIFDDPEFTSTIKNNTEVDNPFKNIIVKYFNSSSITSDDIDKIKHVDFLINREFYYEIPIAIFILEKHMASILQDSTLEVEDNTITS